MSYGGVLVTNSRMKYMLPVSADTGDYYQNLEKVLLSDSNFITILGSTFQNCTGSFAYIEAPTGSFNVITVEDYITGSITGGDGNFDTIEAKSSTITSMTGSQGTFTAITGSDGNFDTIEAKSSTISLQ